MSPSRGLPEGKHLAIGLMSGTSVDGIDSVLVEVEAKRDGSLEPRVLSSLVHPMPEATRREIFALFDGGASEIPPASGAEVLDRLAVLDRRLGELFAKAVLALLEKSGRKAGEIEVVGSHGQTMRHVAGAPGSKRRGSIQIGSGDAIAQLTGIATASDFRTADIAAGGTGAPLVPFFDRIMAERFEKPVLFQNFGGIGNLCYIGEARSAGAKDALCAFDTGPGNMIADRLAELASGGKLRYDRDGELGSRGKVDEGILASWLRHPFLSVKPPKSAGREDFGLVFWREELEPMLAGKRAEAIDLLRTAEAFTARGTAAAYRAFLPSLPRTVIVTGGGARNPLIMADLAAALPEARVVQGDEVGISVDYKEAEAFALFGLLRLHGLPNTEPAATGASRAVSAGKLSAP
jgi:anhydro-N-acetylmuramic acid kinase